jgi:integrase
MPRRRKDGSRAAPARRKSLTDLDVTTVRPDPNRRTVIWDLRRPGLALVVHPTGRKRFKVTYRRHGDAVWYDLGPAEVIGLAAARRQALDIQARAARGEHPHAERRAERNAGTFAELAARYVQECAKKKNRSWRQAANLVRRHALPRLGKMKVAAIARSDIRAMMGRIEAPVVANQTLAAVSAILSWGIKQEVVTVNVCRGIDRNPTRSRQRVLSNNEIKSFWQAFGERGVVGAALRMILLTGQRPGEVARMRREHVKDNWWTLPGEPVSAIGWAGTTNGRENRIWLSEATRAIIAETGDGATGFVFAGPRGLPVHGLAAAMRVISKQLGCDPVRPHDLRRSCGTMVVALGFGRDCMDRILNHREGGVTDIYDRHEYGPEVRRALEAVAQRVMNLAEGRAADGGNVVAFGRA